LSLEFSSPQAVNDFTRIFHGSISVPGWDGPVYYYCSITPKDELGVKLTQQIELL